MELIIIWREKLKELINRYHYKSTMYGTSYSYIKNIYKEKRDTDIKNIYHNK
jgi:hypothetical protein